MQIRLIRLEQKKEHKGKLLRWRTRKYEREIVIFKNYKQEYLS